MDAQLVSHVQARRRDGWYTDDALDLLGVPHTVREMTEGDLNRLANSYGDALKAIGELLDTLERNEKIMYQQRRDLFKRGG